MRLRGSSRSDNTGIGSIGRPFALGVSIAEPDGEAVSSGSDDEGWDL